jgi:hypothetical protein
MDAEQQLSQSTFDWHELALPQLTGHCWESLSAGTGVEARSVLATGQGHDHDQHHGEDEDNH